MRYLDASAIVKLVIEEPESAALEALLVEDVPVVASAIAEVEVKRAAARSGGQTAAARADAVLARITLLAFDDPVRARAAELPPASLRTLDAIHLATALTLSEEVTSFVACDARLAEAATAAGLAVATPGR